MISIFTDPYPGELFYSACARYKASRQYPNYRTVSRVLFGNEHASAIVDFPCHLDYFVNHLPAERIYTVDSLIAKHTLLPFYQPFLPTNRVQEIRQQMVAGPGKGIHRKIGKLRRTIISPSVLRYCPACVAIERATLGECYWHRLHQVPGVIICPHHDVFLENSFVQTTTALRTNTFFAAEECIHETLPRSATTSSFFQMYKKLALSIEELLEAPLSSQQEPFWRDQYMALMAQRGFVTPGGSMRCEEFRQVFLEAYPPELLDQLGCHIKLGMKDWVHWWAGLRGGLRSVQHPLFHLLILQVLGVSVTDFFHQRYTPPAVFGEGPWPCLNPVCRHYRQPVITGFQISKDSHTRRPVGRFTCTCGFSYSRSGAESQPNDGDTFLKIIAYGEVWESKLRELWGDPAISLKEISRRLGVALDTINRQAKRLGLPMPRPSLGKYPPRSGVPHPRPGSKDRAWYRQQWLALLKAHPEATQTQLRLFLRGVHSWLTRHDHAWLNQHMPPPRLRQRATRDELPSAGGPPVPMSHHQGLKDAELATRVNATAQQLLASVERPARITKRCLLIAIPALKVLQYARDHFPLTAQAVEVCQEPREGFGLRRVRWAAQRYAEERVCPTRYQLELRAGILAMRKLPPIHQAVDDALRTLGPFKGHGLALAAV